MSTQALERLIIVFAVGLTVCLGCGGETGMPGVDPMIDNPGGDPGDPGGNPDGNTTEPPTPEEDIIRDGDFGGHPQSLRAYREKLSEDEAWHLLRRAAFGAKPAEVSAAMASDLSVVVADMITDKDVPPTVRQLAESYEGDVRRRWLVHMIEGTSPLKERMTMFWHDRFATSRRVLDGRDSGLALVHWDMLRRNAMGNYRQFLRELTLDPLMLIWLDGANSPKDAPNENYAREFWELFTLGRDVLYSEDDIREGARAFTGITLLRENGKDARPIYDLLNHDETLKQIFPERADASNYGYESVIDLTLTQPEAPQYVARNLFIFFVHDHPSDAVIQELADDLVANNWEIKPLVEKLLKSRAFFSPESVNNQVASPVEHVVGVARTLDMHIHSEDSQGYVLSRLAEDLADAGQDLLNPPGVEGWSEDLGWMQDQWLLARIDALGRTMEYGPGRDPGLPLNLYPPRSGWDQRDIRRTLVLATADAFHISLSEDEIDVYIEVLDQNGFLAFHLENPDRQPRHLAEMIRLMAMDERVIGR